MLTAITATPLYIFWDPDTTAFHLFSLPIRWYSLCWLVGLIGAYLMVKWLYDDQKIAKEKFDPLFLYCFIGILAGCRLGHCLFYEPSYYLTSLPHIVEMVLPIHFTPDGSVRFTGYEGLASHGGTLGLIIGMVCYYLRYRVPLWVVMDNIAIATPITACFIRLGNLMNSEIIGKATDMPWAFIFARVDLLPRHPSQLYEAMAYALFFFVGMHFYRRHVAVGRGFYFGLCLTLIFAFRFVIEYTKENQVAFEDGMLFNMGQLLSVPFVIAGLWCMWHARQQHKRT